MHRRMICGRKTQLDATRWFIESINRSTCFGHYYTHLQELETIQMVTARGTKHFVCSWLLVWDGAVGYASGKRDVARTIVPEICQADYNFN